MAVNTIEQSEQGQAMEQCANVLFEQEQEKLLRRTDRMFAALLFLQWVAGILAAIWISPRTWAGTFSEPHVHVWAAVVLGGVIACVPICMAILLPGRAITRHTIAVGQMLASALLIHLCGGRIETHFHIFGSLAFLAFYRDWRVLITATVVVAVDHFARGIYWPQSVFGVLTPSPWRAVEHAGWVIFEDIFLLRACYLGVTSMRDAATREARLEDTNNSIVAAVDNVMSTAAAVASNSEELSSTASLLATESNQQSSSVNQTKVAVERIFESITENAKNARETDKVAHACAENAAIGGQAVADTAASIKKIAEKIQIIQTIAINTDLLALNAEVEAARVGEQGRGFAVVALEIRKLADVCRTAAKEIDQLTAKNVEDAETAGRLLDEIVPGIRQTAGLIQQIATTSIDQSHNVREVNSTMEQLNRSARQNAETSKLLSATAIDMSSQARQLQDGMTIFHVDKQLESDGNGENTEFTESNS